MKPFKIILLLARPAAGKSEVIDFLSHLPADERLTRFHIGSLIELDDFPMLWAWFEEDAILTRMGRDRLHSDELGHFLHDYFWNVLIERLNLAYSKIIRDRKSSSENYTVLMEFSRGSQHGGYREAFQHLSPEILNDAAILYIDVNWEESLRKNRQRYNPEKPDSILEHGLEDEKLEKLYRDSDWDQLINNSPDFLTVQGIRVPYIVFDNHDDVTTRRGKALEDRLKGCLNQLWRLSTNR